MTNNNLMALLHEICSMSLMALFWNFALLWNLPLIICNFRLMSQAATLALSYTTFCHPKCTKFIKIKRRERIFFFMKIRFAVITWFVGVIYKFQSPYYLLELISCD